MEQSKKPKNEYLDDTKEWMEKRNLPGYYVGGKFPPYVKYPRRMYLILIAVTSIISSIGLAAIFFSLSENDKQSNYPLILFSILFLIIALASIFRILRKTYK